jgi:hypothetical protein
VNSRFFNLPGPDFIRADRNRFLARTNSAFSSLDVQFTESFVRSSLFGILQYACVMVAPILKPWKIWSNVLLTIGAGGFVAVHLLQFGLLGYYTSKRPLEPKPELGWTEPLLWTHGYYGWRAENEQLLRIFNGIFHSSWWLAPAWRCERLIQK